MYRITRFLNVMAVISYIDVPVPMVTAALGGTIDVPTLGGKMTRLQIEKGTQSGRKFRMRGKGMPGLRGGNHGDQIVEIIVETPTKLSKKQINLLQNLMKQAMPARRQKALLTG